MSSMNVEFVRFKAADSLELQGWFTGVDGDMAVVHIHGMSGNGYENPFLDNLRVQYAAQGASLFSIDTRGMGVISWFWQGDDHKRVGSCFELFEESVADIRGAIDFVKSRGKTKIILQGHSLGASKIVNYLVSSPDDAVIGVILLAPTDMVGWAQTDPRHQEYLDRARQLVADGKPEELVGSACWLDETPISAQTYLTLCAAGSAADIYGQRDGGALLSRINKSSVIIYGDEDIGITEIDDTIENWSARTNKVINQHTKIEIIKDAPHSFKNHEAELGEIATNFVKGLE